MLTVITEDYGIVILTVITEGYVIVMLTVIAEVIQACSLPRDGSIRPLGKAYYTIVTFISCALQKCILHVRKILGIIEWFDSSNPSTINFYASPVIVLFIINVLFLAMSGSKALLMLHLFIFCWYILPFYCSV